MVGSRRNSSIIIDFLFFVGFDVGVLKKEVIIFISFRMVVRMVGMMIKVVFVRFFGLILSLEVMNVIVMEFNSRFMR